jgi:hypothetical protein
VSAADTLRAAAKSLRDEWSDAPRTATWRRVVQQNLATADWLDAEAAVLDSFEPLLDALNFAIEHTSGVKSYIEFGRSESGEIKMHGSTTESALRLARAVLDGAR